MDDKQNLPVWQWVLLGVLTVGFVGVLINFLYLSQNGVVILRLPGTNSGSQETEQQEYIPEPTPVLGT